MSTIFLFIEQGTVFQDKNKSLIINNFKEKEALLLLCKKIQAPLKIIEFHN